MPFMELNFSTYEAALALQKSLNQQLLILQKYSKFFGSLICVRRRRRPPKKWTGKILYYIHCFILIILSFIFIISIVMEFIQLLSSQLSIIKVILFCTRLQSLFAFACVFIWFWNNGDVKLQNAILNSSNGIGIVKHRKRLIGLNRTAVIYGFIRVLLYVSIYTYYQYLDNVIVKFPKIEDLEIDQILTPVYLLIILFHFIALPIYNSILTYSLLSIMAEFDGLLDDFDNDENISQLPVIRHYLFAHQQIIDVFQQFKACFSNFLTGCLCLSLIPLSLSFTFKGFQDYTILHYLLFGILILDHIIFISFILILSLKANEKVTGFSYRLLQLVSSNTTLHEEIPSIVIGYSKQIKRNASNSIGIFNIQMFDRKFFVKIIGFSLMLVFLKFI